MRVIKTRSPAHPSGIFSLTPDRLEMHLGSPAPYRQNRYDYY